MIDTLNKLGPFLSGLGVLIASGAAWATFVLFSRRTLHSNWLDSFRKLYDEFWKEAGSRQVRHYIENDVDYSELEPILKKRLSSDRNTLDKDSNAILEQIDAFCALLMKIQAFKKTAMSQGQRELVEQTYGNYWPLRIQTREQLLNYIRRFWPDIEL